MSLDAGVVLEPGSSQPVGELSRVALGEFAVDEQPEPFLEREGVYLGGGELFRQGPGPSRRIVAAGACPTVG